MLAATRKIAITLYRSAPKRMNKLSVHRTITIARANKTTEIRYTPTIDTHKHPSDGKTWSEQGERESQSYSYIRSVSKTSCPRQANDEVCTQKITFLHN